MAKQLQDSVTFTVSAQQTVTNDTVRIIADIACTVLPGKTETETKAQIHSVLRDFIPTAKWQQSGLSRSRDNTGVEKLSLTATTRVSETEYYSLDERADRASVPGVKIARPIRIDIAPPDSMIEKAQGELRMALLDKILKQRDQIEERLGKYRLGNIEFYDDSSTQQSNTRQAQMASSFSNASTYSGGGVADDIIGNTQRMTMHASVTLRRKVAEKDS